MKPASDSIPKFSLLLVEDDDSARELLTNILSKKFPDVAIYTAVNGRSGLELFTKQLSDIVITDINMPEMDGVLMAHKIRAIKSDTKFIAITGRSGNSIPFDSDEKGFAFDFKIMKPVDFQELFNAVDKCSGSTQLRRRAEQRLKTKTPEATFHRKDSETQRLLHELQVHQIELEMQNEELRQAREVAETAQERYTDLYDFAPVGYFTLDQSGVISAVNPSGAKYLGIERSRLIGQKFRQFVVDEALPAYTTFLESPCSEHGKESCEVVLVSKNNRNLLAQMEVTGYTWGNEYRVAVINVTERKLAKQKDKETSDYLYGLFAAIQDGITVLDPNGVHVEVNDAFCTMTGYSKEELIGSGLPHIYWPEEQITAIQAAFSDMSTNKFMERELIFKRKNGERFPVILYPSEMKDKSGKITRYLATVKDVSDRQKAAKALQQSEERYRRFSGLTSDFVYMCSRSFSKPFRIQWLGGAFETITGYSQDELFDMGCWLPLVVDDDRERIARSLIELRPGDHVITEFRIRTKLGAIRWLQESCRCEAGEEPDHLLLYGSSQDITAEKISELALKKSEYFFKESQRSASIGSYFADFTVGKWESSEVLDTIFGIDKNYNRSIQGWLDIIHPDDRDYMDRYLMEDVISNRKPFSMEYRIIRRNDRETRWVNGRGSAGFDSDGNVISLIGTIQDITERKKTEEALSHNERFLKTIIDLEPECIKMLDIDGNLLMMNPAGLEMIQAESFEQVKGHCVYPLVAETNRADFVALTKGVFQGVPGTLDFETVGLKGRHVWLETHAVPFRDEHGEIKALLGVTRDITERKQASEKLLRVMREQSVILNNSPVGICLMIDRMFVWANEKMAEILCCPKSELIGNTNRKIYPSQEAYDKLGKDAYPDIAQGREFVSIQELVRGDGSHMWGRINGKAVDPSDLGKGTIWILEDITERKQAEEKQSQYSAIITSSTDAIISKTLEGVVTSWNPSAEKMFGYTQDEILGRSMALLMPPDRLDEETHILDKIRHGENIEHYETTRLRKNGEVFPVSVTISPIIDKSGTVIGASKIARDISERKRAEQEKHALEQLFLQAQKLESLGVLAGGIAHDFNNILAVIVGHCSLAEMDAKKAIDHIPEIEKAAQRAAGLCRQMLSYAGKEQFIQKDVNMGEVVSDIVTMLKATINQNVTINQNLATDLPVVKADVNQIRQVVMNLIINASEAIGNAQGEVNVALTMVSVDIEHQEKDHLGKSIPLGFYACLEVTDSGCGMSEETKQRIFEPFYTTKFTGRGLGMSAVLGIITAHKGTLQLFSKQGEGTTFKVYLPIQAEDCTGVNLLLQETLSEPWQGRGTVLLVEDEVAIMPIARAMLEMLGFSTIEACNGKEALELYQKYSTDVTLVITDLGMPVMDGYALISELNKLSPTLPIVVSSGFGEASVRERVTLEDIAGVVNKPYNYDQLRDLLKNVMKGRG